MTAVLLVVSELAHDTAHLILEHRATIAAAAIALPVAYVLIHGTVALAWVMWGDVG